jgi:hypothetical protein
MPEISSAGLVEADGVGCDFPLAESGACATARVLRSISHKTTVPKRELDICLSNMDLPDINADIILLPALKYKPYASGFQIRPGRTLLVG